jgi:hypothetical protein
MKIVLRILAAILGAGVGVYVVMQLVLWLGG